MGALLSSCEGAIVEVIEEAEESRCCGSLCTRQVSEVKGESMLLADDYPPWHAPW